MTAEFGPGPERGAEFTSQPATRTEGELFDPGLSLPGELDTEGDGAAAESPDEQTEAAQADSLWEAYYSLANSEIPIEERRETGEALIHQELDRLRPDETDALLSPRAKQIDRVTHIAHTMIEKAEDGSAIADVADIAGTNTLRGEQLPEVIGFSERMDFDTQVLEKQAQLLGIYDVDPAAAHTLVDKGVSGFHVSGAGSLVGVAETGGLMSLSELRKQDTVVPHGERYQASAEGNPAISFADWRAPETLKRYADMSTGPEFTSVQEFIEYHRQQAGSYTTPDGGYRRVELRDHIYDFESTSRDHEAIAQLAEEDPDNPMVQLMMQGFPVAYGISERDHPVSSRAVKLKEMLGVALAGNEQSSAQAGQNIDRLLADNGAKQLSELLARNTGVELSEEELRSLSYEQLLAHINSIGNVIDESPWGAELEGEFMLSGDKLSLEDIPVIAVPEPRIGQVRKLLHTQGRPDIDVIPIEPLLQAA